MRKKRERERERERRVLSPILESRGCGGEKRGKEETKNSTFFFLELFFSPKKFKKKTKNRCGAYAGQHVMAGLLRLRAPAWARVAGARALAVAPTLLLATTATSDAHGGAALDAAAQALNVVQAVQLPFALIPLIRLTASTRVMGKGHVAGKALSAAAAAAAAAVIACNVGVAAQLWAAAVARGALAVAGACCFAGCYLGLAGYLAFGPAANGGVGAARRRRNRSSSSGRRRSRSTLGNDGAREPLLL